MQGAGLDNNLYSIIASVQNDIKNLRTQLENIPPFPKDQRPPSPLARFQNNLEKIEQNLTSSKGLGHSMKVTQRANSTGAAFTHSADYKLPDINFQQTYSESKHIGQMSQPLKKAMQDSKHAQLIADPESRVGHNILRNKYSLPKPNMTKYGRAQGAINKQELDKIGIGQVKGKKVTVPKRILPKSFRDDPFADPPPITEDDIADGMFSLLNRGIIPRDVDLSPAFERGNAPFMFQRAKIFEKPAYVPLAQKLISQPPVAIQYDPQQNNTNTFLTALGNNQLGQLSTKTYGKLNNNTNVQKSPHIQDDDDFNALSNDNYQLAIRNTDDQIAMERKKIDLDEYADMGDDDTANQFNALKTVLDQQQFIIKKGKIQENQQEFVSFKRSNITKWGAIQFVIQQLERLLGQYNVPFAHIDSRRVLFFSDQEFEKLSDDDLISCVANKSQVWESIKNPKQKFKGPYGPVLAAIHIQKNWRRYKAYSAYSQLKFLMEKATVIQRKFRLYQLKKSTKNKIKELNKESMTVWREMQEEFKKRWGEIKKQKRVEIHINSYSISEMQRLSIEKFKQKENAQIARIFSVKDPNVDVIYVCPFTLTNDVYKYYLKILELVEIENPEKRFNIIVPENYVKFPQHYSLAQALLYSPKALKRIQSLIKGKQAYVVPGIVNDYDIKLSIQLAVPILCGEPEKTNLYSTKSGAKRIFQQADVPTPISAYDIYDRHEFNLSLARLIANNLFVNTWIFKIDDEVNGRGAASLNVESIKTIIELRKKKVEMTESIIEKLLEVLKKVLPKKVRIAQPSLFKNWEEFIEHFCRIGGVIEAAPMCPPNSLASPSIAFFIEPDGNIELIGSFDKFAAKEFINAGCFFPQTSLPQMNLMTISKAIGEVLYEKGVVGHVTIDLVSFPDPTNPKAHPLFWAVDINCSLSDYATICLFFDILMEGRLDPQTGEYSIEVIKDPDDIGDREFDERKPNNFFEQRNFMYCKFLHHPGLATIQYKTFFHMCRLESISFDMEKRSGSTFVLYDCLQSGVIAMLTIGVHRKVAVNHMVDALNFIQNQAGVIPQRAQLEDVRVDETSIGDVIQRVRLIHRAFEKKTKKTIKGDKISFMSEII